MTTPDELAKLFLFRPDTSHVVGFGTDAGIARNNHDPAIAVTVNLLDPEGNTPSGKSLFLHLPPVQALILMGAIFAHAKEQDWPIPHNLLEEIDATQLSQDTKKH